MSVKSIKEIRTVESQAEDCQSKLKVEFVSIEEKSRNLGDKITNYKVFDFLSTSNQIIDSLITKYMEHVGFCVLSQIVDNSLKKYVTLRKSLDRCYLIHSKIQK